MSSSDKFVTASDRIKALCDEAMKKPDITVTEKTLNVSSAAPATPAATSRLKAGSVAEAPQQQAQAVEIAETPVMQTPAPAVEEEKPESVPQKHVETDKELAAMLESREEQLQRKSGRVKLVANVMLLLFFVVPATVVAVNPELRGKFEVFVQRMTEGVDDVKQIAKGKEAFDESLEGVAMHGDHINAATKLLGVDPDSVDESEDLEMSAEMAQLMGEDEAAGIQTRKRNLEVMGFFAKKVAGEDEGEETQQ